MTGVGEYKFFENQHYVTPLIFERGGEYKFFENQDYLTTVFFDGCQTLIEYYIRYGLKFDTLPRITFNRVL